MKRFAIILAGITVLGALLRFYAITDQPPLMDEVQVAFSAENYLERGQFGPTMWFHPNLRNLAIYAVGHFSGYGVYALRGISLVAGILSVPLLGMIALMLTGERRVALLTSFLLAMEQVHITFSRQAIQETWTPFLLLAGVALYLVWVRQEYGRASWLLLLSGMLFGLGMASKEHAVIPLAICLIAGLLHAWHNRSLAQGAFVAAALLVVPAIVYLLVYWPWFARGYGVSEWFSLQHDLIISILTTKGSPHETIDIAAWEWFLRPVGYSSFTLMKGRPFITIAYTNPVVWLSMLPALLFTVRRLVRNRRDGKPAGGLELTVLIFLMSYLPLAGSLRPIWLISSLVVIPFGFIIIADAAVSIIDRSRYAGRLMVGYVAVVLVSSLLLYPLAIGTSHLHGSYLSGIVHYFRPEFERSRPIE